MSHIKNQLNTKTGSKEGNEEKEKYKIYKTNKTKQNDNSKSFTISYGIECKWIKLPVKRHGLRK